jgi:cellulose synthase/poly-beta-1,6-N-acetylglucosamine synthase-like glycosyltransferase
MLKRGRLVYLLLFVPFVLAYVCWRWFPVLAWYIIFYGFGYTPSLQPVSWLWHGTLFVFFTIYTFLAIGVGGVMVVAAWIWRRRKRERKKICYPSVSFIVPAYNEEEFISRCVTSLFENASRYLGLCEIIVVDDGSSDYTYEVAWATIQKCRGIWPHVRGRVVRHSVNLGKAEAIRTGVNKSLGELIATVDADTWWEPNAISELVEDLENCGSYATSGYIHPSDGKDERRLYIILQQLEYSQGLGIYRSAQALGNVVLVVPGPIGLYRAQVLRDILNDKTVKSVTEDLEITLEMQRKRLPIGYAKDARCTTVAPTSFRVFWSQRLRWFTGCIHNLFSIHKDLLFKKRLLSLFLWYTLMLGYGSGIIELTALLSLPLFLWFAPDQTFFLLNLLIYALLAFSIGIIYQTIALKFSNGKYNHKHLLVYTPLYYLLRMINVIARVKSLIKYLMGDRGCWQKN